MLHKLHEAEEELPELLKNWSSWSGLDIIYHEPRVERVWRQWGDYRISLRIALSDILCDYDKNGCVSKDVLSRVATILSTSLNFLMDRQEDDIAKLAPAALQAAFMEAYTVGLDIYIARDGAIYCINNKGKNEFIKEIGSSFMIVI